MNFFQNLFGSHDETAEEKKAADKEKNFDVLKYDGIRALKTGQTEYAIKCFRNALALYDDLEIRDYLSLALIHNNELLPAYEELQKLAAAEPDNEKVFIRMASVAYMMEDYNAMADACRKALAINPENAVGCLFYARAYKGLGDYVNALSMATKAIEIDGKYADAYELRAEILLEMDDVNGADADAEWLLKYVGSDEDVLLLKARIERAKGNNEQAVDYYNKVTDVNPFCIEAFRERGAVKLAMGDKEGAEADGQKVLELNPERK